MNDWLKNLLSFLIIVFGYGFIINLMAFGLLEFRFDIFSVAGFGILYYFLTEEVLVWFRPRHAPKAGGVEKTRGEKIAEGRAEEKKESRESAMQRLKKKIDALKLTGEK